MTSAGSTPHKHRALIVATALLIAISASFFAWRVFRTGLQYGVKDQRHYLQTGWNLASGEGYRIAEIAQTFDEGVVKSRYAVFPPLTSTLLAALMKLGVPPDTAPTAAAVILWPLSLALIALLASRLSNHPAAPLWATAFAVISWPLMESFNETASEMTFVPIVLLLALVLRQPPDAARAEVPRAAGTALVLSLMTLSRYVGIPLFVAMVAWWCSWRARQKQLRRLAPELAVLSVGALPIVGFLIALADAKRFPFSDEWGWSFDRGGDIFVRLFEFLKHSVWLPLPAVRPVSLAREFGAPVVIPCAAAIVAFLYLAWRLRPARVSLDWIVTRNVIPFFTLAYLGIFAVDRVHTMKTRYAAILLAIFLPWLVSLVLASDRRAKIGLGLLLVLNTSLLVGAATARPLHRDALAGEDLAGRYDETLELLGAGFPKWLVLRPPRLRDLERHHPRMHLLLAGREPDSFGITTNAPGLFGYRAASDIRAWLERGSCSPAVDVYVFVVDWDLWARGENGFGDMERKPADFARDVLDKCPNAEQVAIDHGYGYFLPAGGSVLEIPAPARLSCQLPPENQ